MISTNPSTSGPLSPYPRSNIRWHIRIRPADQLSAMHISGETAVIIHRRSVGISDIPCTRLHSNQTHCPRLRRKSEHVLSCGHLSFSKPYPNKTLASLRSLNTDSQTLPTKISNSTSLTSRRQTMARRKAHHEVERSKIIAQAPRHVHKHLDKACTKHTQHQLDSCVDVPHAIINQDHGMQANIKTTYTHLTLASSVNTGDVPRFELDSASGDIGCSSAVADFQNAVMHSPNQQIGSSSGAGATQKRVKRSVQVPVHRTGMSLHTNITTAAIVSAVFRSDCVVLRGHAMWPHPIHRIRSCPSAGRLQKGAAAAEKGSSFHFGLLQSNRSLLSCPPTPRGSDSEKGFRYRKGYSDVEFQVRYRTRAERNSSPEEKTTGEDFLSTPVSR